MSTWRHQPWITHTSSSICIERNQVLVSIFLGFAIALQSVHAHGGQLVPRLTSRRQCLDGCYLASRCLAVDWDRDTQTCYFHYEDTYCTQLSPLDGNTHFKKIPCVRGQLSRVHVHLNMYMVTDWRLTVATWPTGEPTHVCPFALIPIHNKQKVVEYHNKRYAMGNTAKIFLAY